MKHAPAPRTMQRRRRSGMALLIVLWVVVLMSVVLTNFAIMARTQMLVARNFSEAADLQSIAESGVQRAIASIKLDKKGVDTFGDEWSNSESTFHDVQIGGGLFNVERLDAIGPEPKLVYGVDDEASKLNLLTAKNTELRALGLLSREQIGSLLDWQDNDTRARRLGAESAAYLQNSDDPYPSKDAPLDSLAELLRIKGFNASTLWGEDWNRNGRLDPNEKDGDASQPPDNEDEVLDTGIWQFVTIWSKESNVTKDGQERANINEANEGDLKRLIPTLTDEEASAIVFHRNQNKFERVGQLVDVKKLKKEEKKDDEKKDDSKEKNNSGNSGSTTTATNEDQFSSSRLKEIIDCCKVNNDTEKQGRVNINTASAKVLKTLPSMNEERAQAIVAAREGGRKFESIAELIDVGGITRKTFEEMSEAITVRSDQFRVRSIATINGVRQTRAVEAVVDRSSTTNPPRILYWNGG